MKFVATLALAAGLVFATPVPETGEILPALEKRAPGLQGLDVDFTTGPGMPWSSLAGTCYFAWIQTTYGMTVDNTYWASQKSDARSYRIVTGGVHHPDPAVASASDQAKFFTANGGGWVLDKQTLRGALYLGANKHNKIAPCYGLTSASWIKWVKEFITAYASLNSNKAPVILTSYDWWKQCTAGYTGFGSVVDVWYFGPSIPTGWTTWKFQQGTFSTSTLWDIDYFNGDLAALQAYAL